jgi:hypothetical protein
MLDAQRTGSGGLAKLGEGVRANSDAKTQAGLSRGQNLGKKLINATWTDTFPAQGATLDLDFANDRGFVRGIGQGKSMDAVTFTRASNGTYVNEQGLLKTTIVNYLGIRSDPSQWGVNRGNITTDEIDPFNGNKATKFLENTITDAHGLSTNSAYPLGNQPTTFSIYVKTINNQWFYLQNTVNGFAYFDLINGVVGTTGGGVFSYANIENIGDGWFRCSVTITGAGLSGTQQLRIFAAIADGSNVYAGNVNNGFFAAFVQWELGGEATEYTENFTQQPRFDWASTEQVAQRNLATNTEVFENDVNMIITPDTTNDPNGNATADKIIPNTTNGQHYTENKFTIDANIYTISVYAKKEEYSGLRILLRNAALRYIFFRFNLNDGTYTGSTPNSTAPTFISANVSDEGNGWYRCSVTIDNTSTGLGYAFVLSATNLSTDTNRDFAGDGTSGIYVWGAQAELGDTLTDYQPIAQPTTTTPLAANPTSNGLLIEEARTNRILWCRDATDAAWVKTNVTAAKDQTGIDGVASAASSLTATANDGTCIQTITLASGSRTGSVYLKRITGTGNIQVTLDGTTYSEVDLLDTEWRRIVLSGTVTNPTVGIKLAVSGDVVAMDYGQVEDGAFATTPILTTTATATRSADFANIRGTNFNSWFNAGKGSLFAHFKSLVPNGLNIANRIATIDNASNTQRRTIEIFRAANDNGIRVGIGSNISLNFSNIPSFNVELKGVAVFNSNYGAGGFNSSTQISFLPPIIETAFQLGIGSFGLNLTAGAQTIKKITYLPIALNVNQIENLTDLNL